jgi:hypothetical protein
LKFCMLVIHFQGAVGRHHSLFLTDTGTNHWPHIDT